MFQFFEKYIKEKANLTGQELETIRALSIQKKLRKRQYLLQEGGVCRYYCFIAKGCLRMYRTGDDGTEHILRFAIENWWMSDRESLTTGQPAKSNIDALEDSEILLWTKENFDELIKTIPAFHSFMDQLLDRSFTVSQNRIYANISYTAEEKYNNFLQTYPDVFNRVPLHMIASYLGVSRETLSRIRNQFVHK